MTDLENKQKKMLDQAAQMQLASAEGNKSVESRKGGTADIEPMRSPNEPKATVPIPQPIKTNEEITQQRAQNLAVQKQVVADDAKAQLEAKTKDMMVGDDIKRSTKPIAPMAKRGFQPEKYIQQNFDKAAAEKAFNEDATFQDIINKSKDRDKEYDDKAKKASKYAKAAAWGNMFSALGQIAGLGKNTYVKPDSKYLDKALTKADEARAMYDKIKAAEEEKRTNLKRDYLAKAEAQHWANEKLKADSIKELNKVMQSADKADKELAIKMYTANIDKMYKDGLLSKKDYENETKRITALAAQTRANASAKNAELKETEANRKTENNRKKAESSAFINYKDNDIKQNYNLNESEARRIANYMIKNKNYTSDRLGLVGDAITGTISASNYGIFKSQVLDFIEHGGGKDIPEVKAILDNSDNYSFDTLGEESDL